MRLKELVSSSTGQIFLFLFRVLGFADKTPERKPEDRGQRRRGAMPTSQSTTKVGLHLFMC